ncbi:helix-turn-helix transcriptional regulator [Actinophytocola sp. KF-1]
MGRRSPVVVGRGKEINDIRDALDAARAGRGRTVFLVGESGIGKSRLATAAAELAFDAGMRLLRGRGTVIGPMVPFRSLTEALFSLSRDENPVDVAALGPYRPILARLVPDWGAPATQDGGSVVVLAEAVLRLTALAGRGCGCLLTLDDLQDTDAETLAVVEYLIDNLDRQPTTVIGTIRSEPSPALRLARLAAQRGTAVVVELERLTREETGLLAAACLGTAPAEVPEPAVDLLWAGSAGIPFHAEELVSGMVDGGLLVSRGGRWHTSERLQTRLPETFARSLARPVDLLDPRAKELLTTAAMIGNRFPLAAVRAATGLTDRDLLSYLHEETAAQLVDVDEQTPDWYCFRHRLIREALLTTLSAAERAALARKAADTLPAVYPGLPGEWCQVTATLLVEAGDTTAAGRLFTEAGRRALAQGAASSAVALLDRAWELLPPGDTPARADTMESLLYALAEGGLVERALTSIGVLDQLGGGLEPKRRARLHTRLAWAAVVAGQPAQSMAQLDAARALLGPEASPEDTAPVDVVAAHLALDLGGQEQFDAAEAIARKVAVVAEAVPLPVVACQALQLLGAVVRARDPAAATAYLERAHAVAVQHDLPIWVIHALVRLGNDDALREADTTRVEQAREQAARVGAVSARYLAETVIATHTVLSGDFATAGTLLDQVIDAAGRLRLRDTLHQALLARAMLAAHRGRRRDMDRVLARFRELDGDALPMYASRVHGLVRAVCALLEEDRPAARDELAQALHAEDTNPSILQLSGRHGLHLLVCAVDGDLDQDGFDAVVADPADRLRWDRQFALFARAVLAGRAGRAEQAAEDVAEAMRAGAPYAMAVHLGLRLVGEAAIADGWGTHAEWLRAAEDYFHGADVPAVASACRALLRGTGERVAPRRTGAAEIPPSLRSAGVTVREFEVLRLLAERLGNREIAERLHLSTRTVEGHVSSLITKTGLPNRRALSKLALSGPDSAIATA